MIKYCPWCGVKLIEGKCPIDCENVEFENTKKWLEEYIACMEENERQQAHSGAKEE